MTNDAPAQASVEAVAILTQARDAYTRTTRMQTISGETEAERRASEGEARDYAAEIMFGELGGLTIDHIEALLALSPPPTVGAEDEAPVAWMWTHEDGTRSFVSDLDTKRIWERTMKRVLVPVYTRPAPSADEQRVKDAVDEIEGLVDGYDREKSDWYWRRTVIRLMLSRIRASLATDKEG